MTSNINELARILLKSSDLKTGLAEFHHCIGRFFPLDFFVSKEDPSPISPIDSIDAVEQGCLTCAIRPYDGKD